MAEMLESGDEGLDLAVRVQNGEPLVLNRRVLTILRRAAREVGIATRDIEPALQSTEAATALLRTIRMRKRRHARRFARALLNMYERRDAGDIDGARMEMRKLLAVADDPHDRRVAQGQLDQLDNWKPPKGKTPARKAAPPRKAPARKAPARKAPARKAPARKAPGKAPARNRRKTGKRS